MFGCLPAPGGRSPLVCVCVCVCVWGGLPQKATPWEGARIAVVSPMNPDSRAVFESGTSERPRIAKGRATFPRGGPRPLMSRALAGALGAAPGAQSSLGRGP